MLHLWPQFELKRYFSVMFKAWVTTTYGTRMKSEGLLRTTNQMFEFKASDILDRVWKEVPAPLLPQYKSHNPNFCHLYREYHGGLGFSFSNKGSISRGTSLNTITFIQVLLGTVSFYSKLWTPNWLSKSYLLTKFAAIWHGLYNLHYQKTWASIIKFTWPQLFKSWTEPHWISH